MSTSGPVCSTSVVLWDNGRMGRGAVGNVNFVRVYLGKLFLFGFVLSDTHPSRAAIKSVSNVFAGLP